MSATTVPGPRWYQDIPWRVGYRIQHLGLLALGPASLPESNDPIRALERRRQERFAARYGSGPARARAA